MSIVVLWFEDVRFHYGVNRLSPGILARAAFNASLRACLLVRLTAAGPPVIRVLARRRLLRGYGCDVAPGADILGALDLPHPLGIVIGSGVVLGRRVRIYQHVTVGRSSSTSYPIVGDDVTMYAKSTVIGSVRLGAGATIGAHALVMRDVAPGAVVRAA